VPFPLLLQPVVDFIPVPCVPRFPVLTVSTADIPKAISSSFHSESEGKCQPLGQIPCTPLGLEELVDEPFITVAQS